MKLTIAKYLIESTINSGKYDSFEEARSALPAWVRNKLDTEEEVRQYWDLCCLLESKLKSDASEFCNSPEMSRKAMDWSPTDASQHTVSFGAASSVGHSASSVGQTAKWIAPALAIAAGVCAIAFVPKFWSNADLGQSVQSPEQEPVDLRPLMATASASRTVLLRLSQAAEDSFTVLERSAAEMKLEEKLPTSDSTGDLLRGTREGWKSSVKHAVGLLTMKE